MPFCETHQELSVLRLSERSLGEGLITVHKYLHKEKVPDFPKVTIILCRKDLTRTDDWELKPGKSHLDIKFTI